MHTNNSVIGWTVKILSLGDWSSESPPVVPAPHFPPCTDNSKLDITSVPWKGCSNKVSFRYDIPGTNRYILDWSDKTWTLTERAGWTRKLDSGLWTSDSQHLQSALWKLMGVMEKIDYIVEYCKSGTPCTPDSVLDDGSKNWITVRNAANVSACVPSPYALLIGNIDIQFEGNHFHVFCNNCTLANCASWVPSGTQIMVLKQPPFVMLPVNISEPWYAERSLQIFKEIEHALSRQKRFIGLLIAGIVALVTVVATAATAAVALSQTIQNANYVNTLTKNVSLALGTQEDIDTKLEEKLNALYDAVQYMGSVIHSMKVKSHLECHPEYHWICVTSKEYNQSQYEWDRVRLHLQGVWHNANVSLDMLRLHEEIKNMREAEPLRFDAAQAASDFVNALKNAMPSLPSMPNLVHSVLVFLTLGICVCVILCLLPVLIRAFINKMMDLRADIHQLELKTGL
ncbi:endogenous retrovirus group K member 7 Env polyprotein-like [Rhinolophus ferrumequinum]|uniref:endogenous retrovirus group K member 7 Env polyprotein-like n=1 Tax=Rhinolophus ferrumequinum TaxID=59479 RepID=UPI00140F7929|nr:endogenous retrovirus group K member 7 Env polyprotein-like [Rhinolophus ferrumequinum]